MPSSKVWLLSPVWAGFPERTRDGNKFVVAERPQKGGKYGTETTENITEERKIRRESNGFFDESGIEEEDSRSNLLDAVFGD